MTWAGRIVIWGQRDVCGGDPDDSRTPQTPFRPREELQFLDNADYDSVDDESDDDNLEAATESERDQAGHSIYPPEDWYQDDAT